MDMREIGQILCLVAFWLSLFMSFMTINSDDVWKISTTAVKTKVFNSPQINLSPGSVCNKYYYDIDFPRGHIALKSFSAELVDGNGVRVPLHEAYLHHWTVFRYYGLIDSDTSKPKVIHVGNSGPCKKLLGQYFGLGSETRKTNNWVPSPYGIEVGNPKDIPEGYEERWVMNVHAIDTRGVVDKLGCTECRCSLYNVTKAPTGQPLPKEYVGGLYCCEDQTHCRLKEGFSIETRKLFMRYTVRWMDWDDSILPVKIYLFDVTYTLKDHSDVSDITLNSSCKIEYAVEPCSIGERSNSSCLDSRRVNVVIPSGGEIVYGVAHQHAGGVGSTLYRQDGRVLCTSIPQYGTGEEVGNELGHIVGMSTCYPRAGSATVGDGEVLILESNYSSSQMHTGVMGLFYVLVAEQPPKSIISETSNLRES